MRIALAAAGVLLALQATPARACGYCLEDQIAAVYDHAVASQALARQHHVAFFHLDGPLAPGRETQRRLVTLAEEVPGVDPGSVRLSTESAALALAYDPQRTSPARVRQALAGKLVTWHLSLDTLRIMERPAEFKGVGQ